jgi:hypothetical protein
MVQIYNLNTINSLNGNDSIIVYSTLNSGTSKTSLNTLLEFIAKNYASPQFQKQQQVVTSNNFNVQVNDTSSNTWLVLNLINTFSVGSITLPYVSNCIEGQEVLVNCSYQVNSFTVNANGSIAVYGAPSALAARSFFKLRFNSNDLSWYRVG